MKLKLGKLPDTRMVKLTLVLRAELKAQIDRYARIHSQTWGQEVSPDAMIPQILEQFLLHDRAFQKLERETGSADRGPG